MKTSVVKLIIPIVLGVAFLVVLQSCTESQGKGTPIPKTSEPIPVKIRSINKSTSENEIQTSGKISTDDETTLAFKTGGVVDAIYVKEGQKITKGQILATLDLTEINTFVAQSKFGLEKAERDLTRARNLYQDSVATLEQLQNAETAFELANEQHQATIFNQSYSQIKAVGDGYVLKKFVNAGQVVGVGDPVIMTNGAGSGEWIVRCSVSDRQWSEIKVADKAIVKVDAYANEEISGTIIRKSENADPATGAFTVEVELKSKVRFATGMFAYVRIVTSQRTESWSVPFEAVLDANGNEGFVFITNDEKTAIRKPVVVESFDGSSILVSSGLEDAKSIIVSGSAYLTDHSPITIVK